MSQMIDEPTRITDTSETAIHLILSDPDKVTQCGVLPCKISNHNVKYILYKISVKGEFNKQNVTKIT